MPNIEREFLNKLEGGCSAPIGALAYIKEEEIHFHGIVLSPDGTKKIEAKRTAKLGEHYTLVDDCVEFILSRGGKTLIGTTAKEDGPTTIFSSKLLSPRLYLSSLLIFSLKIESALEGFKSKTSTSIHTTTNFDD